jgi:hypothetical protein
MTGRPDPSPTQPVGGSGAIAARSGSRALARRDARVAAGSGGYALVLSLPSPVLSAAAERVARPFGRSPSDLAPTGGAR